MRWLNNLKNNKSLQETSIKPFKGVVYNLANITDASRVMCPPYDVINSEQQDYYYSKSPYNFIRLDLNKSDKSDSEQNNRYTRSVAFFNDWLRDNILKQNKDEAIYFYKQDYFCNSKEYSRVGFIALLELKDSGGVYPHENTHAAAKLDRLELTKKIKANLSPIFTIFEDKKKAVKNIFNKEFSHKEPEFLLKDVDGVRNSIWRLTDKDKIEYIKKNLADKQIFIADGHHRYEVSSNYRNLMKAEDKNYSLDKSYNYVMTYFTPLDSSSLTIFPIHRLIKTEIDISKLYDNFKISRLSSVFDLEEKLLSFSNKKCVFGVYQDEKIFLLELKDKKKINCDFMSKKCFKNLNVAILDYYVLNELLKVDKNAIIYTKQISEAKESVDKKEVTCAFILKPTTVEEIRDVALQGEKMPPKSTYFYPKLLSGLVVHKF